MTPKFFVLIVLVLPVFSRVRRQGTLEDAPVLPFSAQSNPRDESRSIEVLNENAEKGIIDNKDIEAEEIIEYVDQSGPGADPDAELDATHVDEPSVEVQETVISTGGLRVIELAPNPNLKRGGSVFGRSSDTNKIPNDKEQEAKDQKAEDMRNKKNTFWIIFGVSLGIMLLFLFACLFAKCKSK